MATLHEREYVSPNTSPTLGVVIHIGGIVADPDDSVVVVTMYDSEDDVVFARAATRVDVGTYEVTLSSAETATPGEYHLGWFFEVSGVENSITTYIDVGEPSPTYDALPDGIKMVLEYTYNRFEDLYDSPIGGPHLQTYIQGNFGRERMAQMSMLALNRLNIISQPHQSYTLDNFPHETWGGLLEFATYVEILKHLKRSYVEQPNVIGATVSYLERRDYMDRWDRIYQDEVQDLKDALDGYKIAHMGLGAPSVLVSGGVYGNFGPERLPGSAAARPHYYNGFF